MQILYVFMLFAKKQGNLDNKNILMMTSQTYGKFKPRKTDGDNRLKVIYHSCSEKGIL